MHKKIKKIWNWLGVRLWNEMPACFREYNDSEPKWNCHFDCSKDKHGRLQPFHEVGCPHNQKWTRYELQHALEGKKKFEALCVREGLNKYWESAGPQEPRSYFRKKSKKKIRK